MVHVLKGTYFIYNLQLHVCSLNIPPKMYECLKLGLSRHVLKLPYCISGQTRLHRSIFTSVISHKENRKPVSSESIVDLLDNASVDENANPSSPDSYWLTSPYKRARDQASQSHRVKGDPSGYSIILFPGQGTQYVGMAKSALSLPVVKQMFKTASEILKWDLAGLCLNGPKAELDRTDKAQPAILVSSLAALEVMKEKEPHYAKKCIATAGFSVGEYAALVFSGVLSFPDAVRLVKARGMAMQLASELVPSSMMTVIMDRTSQLGLACTEAVRWCIDNGVEKPVCSVASYLYPHCKVIAGHSQALTFIEKNAKSFNLLRCKRLPVSGAFHTTLMTPAIEPFKKVLQEVDLHKPIIPVYSNVDGQRYSSPYHIARLLCKQIVAPVKWEQTLHILTEYKKESKLPRIYECGPGRSLSAIVRMVNNRVECHTYEP